jgi:aminoglycoside 6-adenylyltransferase
MTEQLIKWGVQQDLVRAIVLTSSRAIPNNPYTDQYSDYDVILALRDVRPFHDSREWLAAFGTVLAMYCDPMYEKDGLYWSANVVQFEEGLKIDFTLWPVEMMRKVAQQETLPEEFDAGIRCCWIGWPDGGNQAAELPGLYPRAAHGSAVS